MLATLWPQASFVFLDANGRRTRFLDETVEQSGWRGRVTVACARAETAGREPSHRRAFDAVFARGFGAPATTAECAAPFLRTGGSLIVAEPPPTAQAPSDERWPAEGCEVLGLEPVRHFDEPVAAQVLRQSAPCDERFPRRDGVPAKRPLF